ncbi:MULTISPECIES: hypothetical protein [Tatumella]|uniref:Uncharacterized protein n=1 Tax=Tatumella punctata TaxID=399969 RepID=A0ABW1VKV6_9GAMM|nr:MULTISPECIES: hypothetical protein [unclassified Tatumella]MBS0857354.1 hypothetical protein [Tatumella sp. JGM16]MBS0878743.1 hypothetical protein [Tatumella sp. JGM82]MBS0892236.1 hypothetical protein [Tatumella sp. JGM94]MBS0894930.1 hypothetical protein [Tatumella sp. JGM130]MBS0903366.1 hypothetical protein [Tatumella sp. JGM100]
MKELSITETTQISGGLFTLVTGPVGGLLGFTIGSIVDAGVGALKGQSLSFKTSGALLGAGIGAIVGLSPILATTGIGLGVVSIVDNAKKFLAS